MSKIKSSLNTILVIIIYILLYFVLSELLVNILSVHITTLEGQIAASLFLNIFVYLLMLVSTSLLMHKEIKTDFSVLCKTDSMKVFYGCLLAIISIYFGNFIGNIISTIIGSVGESANESTVNIMLMSDYGLILAIIVCFVGPFVEEMVFRKAVHNTLRTFKVPTWLILCISSLLFGLIHVVSAGDIEFIFPYIFSGLVFGFLEIYYKSVFPGVIVHIINNSMSCIILFLLELIMNS